jgi:signal peptidase I
VLIPIVAILVIVALVRLFAIEPVYIRGHSMEPGLRSGELRFVQYGGYSWVLGRVFNDQYRPAPRPGEVIVLHRPVDGAGVVKRVVGVAGDTLEIVRGDVLRNGQRLRVDEYAPCPLLDEPWDGCVSWRESVDDAIWTVVGITEPDRAMGPIVVPDGYLFLLGDRRDCSQDSRDPAFGLIPVSRVRGHLIDPSAR